MESLSHRTSKKGARIYLLSSVLTDIEVCMVGIVILSSTLTPVIRYHMYNPTYLWSRVAKRERVKLRVKKGRVLFTYHIGSTNTHRVQKEARLSLRIQKGGACIYDTILSISINNKSTYIHNMYDTYLCSMQRVAFSMWWTDMYGGIIRNVPTHDK